ncbi:hypothetical protein DSL72_008036 [Monilinia vaccinii-corymbosi]|uniref:Tesmin/TSO1-like CXC domain-containing protein n=1 Tax=Monilinia vaccinii-corymbosi TaxID=61207 RepID=A0A8A3PJI4_9HELO|nr:hypothetical protein DSL72_008036 [Monilinia vaccinii-corymbosi]
MDNDARLAKRRKYPLSTPGPSHQIIQDLLMDLKPSQLRQVIDVALKGGDVKRCIRHIHARLPMESPNEDHSDLLAPNGVPVKDEVIESIEILPVPERRLPPVAAPLEIRQLTLQSSSIEQQEVLPDNVTQALVHLPKLANNGNLLTPRNSQKTFPKEVPMISEPHLAPEPDLDTHPSPSLNPQIHMRSPQAVTCNCRSGCFSTRCKCYKSGRGCSPSPFSGCKCESCVNMLNDLSSFFGFPKSSSGLGLAVSPDLMKWIRRGSRNGRFDLLHPDTMEELRSMLMGVEFGDIRSPPTLAAFSSGKLGAIRRAWARVDLTDDEREDVRKELFTEAFGVVDGEAQDSKREYWCFCENTWKQTALWQYCAEFDECRNI